MPGTLPFGRKLRKPKWPIIAPKSFRRSTGLIPEVFAYVDYVDDFRAEFHDIRKQPAFRDCLSANSHAASQRLAQMLLQEGSAGIIYPSVREKKHGDCISCFRPALVTNVRRGVSLDVRFEDASAVPTFVTHC